MSDMLTRWFDGSARQGADEEGDTAEGEERAMERENQVEGRSENRGERVPGNIRERTRENEDGGVTERENETERVGEIEEERTIENERERAEESGEEKVSDREGEGATKNKKVKENESEEGATANKEETTSTDDTKNPECKVEPMETTEDGQEICDTTAKDVKILASERMVPEEYEEDSEMKTNISIPSIKVDPVESSQSGESEAGSSNILRSDPVVSLKYNMEGTTSGVVSIHYPQISVDEATQKTAGNFSEYIFFKIIFRI